MRRFRYGKAEEENRIGHVTGLAWTEVGGELLTIEAAVVPGKGKLQHTGQLGEVMQESIQAAMTVVRSRANVLGIDPDFYQKHDVHLHMPEGATPKDGPSAGIGMCTALVSALTKIPVRSDVAMTGEITLRGEVLPIGGLKEKLLAAHRGGITTVMIPVDNEKDLTEIPDNIKGKLDIRPVKWIDEVFEIALASRPTPRLATPPAAEAKSARAARGKAVDESWSRRIRNGLRPDFNPGLRPGPWSLFGHFRSWGRSARLRGLSRAAGRVLSSAVEHRPYKARVGGSKPSAPTKIGAVVQLVRIPACHAGGRGFESRPLRQSFRPML